jgi:hypothetical protein
MDGVQEDDAAIVARLIEAWLDALETQDWDQVDAALDQHAVVFVPSGRGALHHVKSWPEVRATIKRRLAIAIPDSTSPSLKVGRREVTAEVKGSVAVVTLRSGPADPGSPGALILSKDDGQWRISHLQLGSLDLVIGEAG